MKFNRKELLDGLRKVSNIITHKTTIACLSYVKISWLNDSEIKLQTTNLEIFMDINIPCECNKFTAFLLPCKLFLNIVSKLSGERLELEDLDDVGNYHYKIKSNNADILLSGISADDFPIHKPSANLEKIELDSKIFINNLNELSYIIDLTESRQVLLGVLFTLEAGELCLVATDGKRLGINKTTIETAIKEFKVIIPLATVLELKRSFDTAEKLIIQFNSSHIIFSTATQCLYSKVIEGDYPNYKRIIPADLNKQVELSRTRLLSSLELVNIANFETDSPVITMKFSKDKLTLSSKGVGASKTIKDVIAIEYGDEDMKIEFNAQYIIEPFQFSNEDKMTMTFKDGDGPSILKSDNGFDYIIMPIRTKGK